MKKNIIKAIIALSFAVGAIVSFNVDVKARVEPASMEGSKNCDYPGGIGIPFWDRTCSDCSVHFNNYYNRGYRCYN